MSHDVSLDVVALSFVNINLNLYTVVIMKILLLGGNSTNNIRWLDEMETLLRAQSYEVIKYYYSHWKTGESLIDLDQELKILKDVLGGSNYVVIAKSAGALLCLKGIKEKILAPKACIFLGIAVLWGRENGFGVDGWLEDFSTPALFIHKSGDPAIEPIALKDLLKKSGSKNYEIITIPGAGHDYSDYKDTGEKAISFLKGLEVNQ